MRRDHLILLSDNNILGVCVCVCMEACVFNTGIKVKLMSHLSMASH